MLPTIILKNTSNNTFHPMPFRCAPKPSETYGFVRHKSIGHHTDGFASFEEAKQFIDDNVSMYYEGMILSWDGSEIPACVLYFERKPSNECY